jgi:hypothetical protein
MQPLLWKMCRCLAFCVACACLAPVLPASAAPDADWPAWAGEEEALRQRIAAVNEGELVFLVQATPGAVHHHSSHISITERSLSDGWVVMEQCHDDLDRVAEAQIVFNPQRSRALQVVSYRNIKDAFAEGNTIQLRGIRAASQVCLRAESQALLSDGGDVFELQNGPFMRRFLDGYYPLRVSLLIDHPPWLMLTDFAPQPQPGFAVTRAPGRISVEALFEGQLRTRFRFLAR